MASSAALEKLLNYLIDIKAPTNMIGDVKDMIKKAEAKNTKASSEYKKTIESFRLEQMDGFKKHHQAIKMEMQTHDDQLAEVRAKFHAEEDKGVKLALQRKQVALEEERKILKARVEIAGKVESFFTGKGLVLDFDKSATGKFLNDMPGAFNAVGVAMSSALKPANLFAAGVGQMISATKELFTSFDKAQSSLSQTTATTGEYNDMLYDVQESNKAFNVSVEDAGQAISDLHNEVSTFNQLSSDQQTALTETTARMKALGVSTSTSAQQFDNMIQGMGMSAQVANDASMELVSLGDNIGVAADVISKDFNSAAGELAKYGADAIDVFKGMAAAAKATGIEMSSLMNVTKQYDTFEGAATAAGKLNAILGGGVLNSMDMLNATEEERVRLLVQSISLSGKNYESLNKFEKQAIASAAGISDMTEANKLFSMSLGAYDEMQNKSSAASAEAAKLEERAQAATTFGEKLKMIGQSFAVAFLPVLEFAHGFANIILELNDMTNGMFIPSMVALVGVIALLANATAIYNGITKIGMSITAARSLITSGYGNILAFVDLVKTGSNIREKAGIALDLMSIPVKQAKNIATTQEGVASGFAAGGTAMLAKAMAKLSAAALPLIPAITAIGFAIGGLALAFAAPFIAIGLIVTAFKDLFIAMLDAPEAIGEAVVGLMLFGAAGAAALIMLSTGLAASAMIMIGVAPQMLVIAPALALFAGALAIAGVAMYLAGHGLLSFARGLAAFSEVSFEALGMAILSLTAFAIGLVYFAFFAAPIMLAVGFGLMLFGAGLAMFANGLAQFNKVGVEAMGMALLSLMLFGVGLVYFAGFATPVMAAVGAGLILFGLGLFAFGFGLAQFNNVGIGAMLLAAASLALFALLLIPIAFILPFIAAGVAMPLIYISVALMAFALGLSMFNKVGGKEIASAVASLLFLSAALVQTAVPLAVAAAFIVGPLVGIGFGLMSFAMGLAAFNKVGAGAIVAAIASLALFGAAMYFFIMTGLLTAMVIGFYALSIPLMLFGAGLTMVGLGLLFIGESIPALFALTDALSVIVHIGTMGALAMGMLAYSIIGIAFALSMLPESKTMAFGFAMDGYSKAMAAVSALTPETAELAERVVAAAGEYATIQAEMKMPDEDAFVQAMKNAFGMGDKGDSGGQDIVLEINGREFGRAINAAINKTHNLRID